MALRSGDGPYQWSQAYGGGWASAVTVNDLATDSNGNILMAGVLTGSIDFGGRELSGISDAFIAKISP